MSVMLIACAALAALVAIWPSWMAALTASRDVDHYVDQELRTYKMGAVKIYKGSLVGVVPSTGYARALAAGDIFVGLAYHEVDNSAGSAGDKSIKVYTAGDFAMTLTGAAITNIGQWVYATTDNDLTFSAAANAVRVGHMIDLPAANTIILRLDTRRFMGFAGFVTKVNADSPVTLTLADNGKIFNNLGATGAVVFQLPSAPPAGITYRFVAAAAQSVRIKPGANDALYVSGAKQADNKYVDFDDEAEHVDVVSNEAGDWLVINSAGTLTVEA
ncbi:MAG: hypothetical protein U1A27_00115 [Phycisphaerae bacterium]